MDRKSHWDKVYASKSHKEVSWYAEHIQSSLALIERAGASKSAAIIDIGGGASTLAEDLLKLGFRNVAVLDVSGAALKIAQERLGAKAGDVSWIEGDLLEIDFSQRKFDLWHDRAVFHFLTEEADRLQYKVKLLRHLKQGGKAIFSVFADDGPEKCSLLDVRRHHEDDLFAFFQKEFDPSYHERTVHKTPSGTEQRFVNVILKRKSRD